MSDATGKATLMIERGALIEAELERFVTVLTEQYRPQKIVLFGAVAEE